MKKKYSIEEFKEMFDKAMKLALEETKKDFKEASNNCGHPVDALQEMAFTMQNAMAYAALRKNLFGGKENE